MSLQASNNVLQVKLYLLSRGRILALLKGGFMDNH